MRPLSLASIALIAWTSLALTVRAESAEPIRGTLILTEAEPIPIRAVDGDTIAMGTERIRLVGYDTPETAFARCTAEKRLGLIAKARLQALLDRGPVTIHRTGKRDKYGRTLASVRIDGRDVGAILIAEGMAVAYTGRTARIDWCATAR